MQYAVCSGSSLHALHAECFPLGVQQLELWPVPCCVMGNSMLDTDALRATSSCH